MRCHLTTTLFCLLFAITAAQSQNTSATHPNDPDAKLIGRYSVHVETPHISSEKQPTVSTDHDLSLVIAVFRVGIRTDVYVNVDSITFTKDDGWDNMSTREIFDLIGQVAVSESLQKGLLNCVASCLLAQPLTRVIVPACVHRDGKGIETHFTACDETSICIREYIVCCPVGALFPTIQMTLCSIVNGIAGGCNADGTGCESTC
ncbi:MAG: hypothetical protein JST22_02040 [Bacteroidetes bacterium]|nr:hypothetical protein [Bacteroidota bacterium]